MAPQALTPQTSTQRELPFGVDLSVDLRRLRLPLEPECSLPKRLKLVPGREFTARGVRGRLRFRGVQRNGLGEWWIEAFDCDGRWRSIAPDRVRRVHRKSRTVPVPGLPARRGR